MKDENCSMMRYAVRTRLLPTAATCRKARPAHLSGHEGDEMLVRPDMLTADDIVAQAPTLAGHRSSWSAS